MTSFRSLGRRIARLLAAVFERAASPGTPADDAKARAKQEAKDRAKRAAKAMFSRRAATLTPVHLDEVLPILVDPETHEPLSYVPEHRALVALRGGRRFRIVDEVARLHVEDARPLAPLTLENVPEVVPRPRSVDVFVLDVGTKTGRGVQRVRAEHSARIGLGPKASWGVVGIDLHASRVAQARSVGIFPVRADATKMPFADRSFDLTVITELLEHVPRDLAVDVLREARRVTRGKIFIQNPDFSAEAYLRSEGLKFAWMDWRVHPHHVTARGMHEILAAAGFSAFDVEQIRPVADSSHRELVPLDAPTDTLAFDPALHTKPLVSFTQPVFEKLRVVLDIERHAR